MISIVTPAFNEAGNLQRLHARIVETMGTLGVDWEWIVVDDHSRDDTFAVSSGSRRPIHASGCPSGTEQRLARGNRLRLASHERRCRGHDGVGSSDPPETIGAMLERWRRGAQIVWAVRCSRPGDHRTPGSAAAHYWIVRNAAGSEMPAKGTDFFLADRRVVDAFRAFPERTTSLFNHLTWMGFTQELVDYEKQPRTAGASGWTLARKIRLVIDSVTAFSNAPLRWCESGRCRHAGGRAGVDGHWHSAVAGAAAGCCS